MADEKVDYLAVWMEMRRVETLVDSMVVVWDTKLIIIHTHIYKCNHT